MVPVSQKQWAWLREDGVGNEMKGQRESGAEIIRGLIDNGLSMVAMTPALAGEGGRESVFLESDRLAVLMMVPGAGRVCSKAYTAVNKCIPFCCHIFVLWWIFK